jgi:hypothetical protein
LAAAVLAGCGGYLPGLDPDELFGWHYGSIALNPETFAIAITANQPSQETSDQKAVQTCGSAACIVVLRYVGQDRCGAIARGSNRTYGVGTGSSIQDAQGQALQHCLANGGLDCQPGLADCNG